MSELRLSIIIPVYKAEAYIRPCVESLFRQGLAETQFEVILVDDGTPDRSIEVLEELLAAHACIRVIRQENQGVSVARNTGIGASRGKYLLFVDADDMLVDDCLGRMLDVAERNRLDMLKGGLKKAESGMMEQIRNNWVPASFAESEVKTGEQAFIEDYDPMEGYCWLYCSGVNFWFGITSVSLLERALQRIPHLPRDAICMQSVSWLFPWSFISTVSIRALP